jgi:putative ABC transport system permease protein
MSDIRKYGLTRPHLWLIRVIGVIVPRRLRADWRQEWEAELRSREALLAEWERLDWRNKLDLLRRSLGAFWDALLLQPRRLEDEMFQDLRFGLQMMMKNPGFTFVAVITLALGIGANTAIFSVVNATLLRPLPYPQPEQLVLIQERNKSLTSMSVSYPNFIDYREQNQVCERMAAFRWRGMDLTGGNEPERLIGLEVSAGFFETLGVSPIHGRTIRSEEDRDGAQPVVVIGHDLWARRSNSDPNLVGRGVTINGISHMVIGIMPPGFLFLGEAQLWTPLGLRARSMMDRGDHQELHAMARLKPGIQLDQARADLGAIARRLELQYKASNEGVGVNINSLTEDVVGYIRPTLRTLFGAVGLVLLIACANVANLLLARAAARRKEMAVRAALGAGRSRLIRQLLTESALMAAIGGALGIELAYWTVRLLKTTSFVSGSLPRAEEINIDGRALLFTLALSLLTGIIFGLAPALQASRADVHEALKEGWTGAAGGFSSNRVRSLLVVVEIALAMVVLIGGGLMLQSFIRLMRIDPGFKPDDALVMDMALPPARYPAGESQTAFYQRLLERIGKLPGVQAAGLASPLPFSGRDSQSSAIQDGAPFARENIVLSDFYTVSPDYFQAMGVRLIKGRSFTERDTESAPLTIVVDEMTAQRFWPNQDPIGARMAFEFILRENAPPLPRWREVIGVVGHVKHYGLTAESRQQIYVSYLQMPHYNQGMLPQMSLILRAPDDTSLISAARSEVLALDRNLPVYNVRTMDQALSNSVARTRLSMWLMGAFALTGLLLAASGIFGLVSYTVTQRRHEIGVRRALGAQSRDVLRLIVGRGMRLALVGVALGLVASFGLTRLISSLLVGIDATDPLTFGAVALLLLLVSLVAAFVPSRRATKVDPLVALRSE